MLPQFALSSAILFHNFKENTRVPILAPLMDNRSVSRLIVGAAALQGEMVVLGWPGWPCPFLHVLGIPCPGCGLSRAIVALFEGDWSTAFTLHAFAPFFVLALALLACSAVLPGRFSQALLRRVDFVERRTGMIAILLIGLVLYWLIRLLVVPSVYINLIRGAV